MDKWGRLAWDARRCHGVVTLADALRLGISDDAMERRAREQRWERPFPGVYVMPGHPPTLETELMAALRFLGEGAAIARRSAGQLWGLIEQAPPRQELLVPHRRRPGRAADLCVLRPHGIPDAEIVTLGALAVTRIDRTLCDLAAVLDEEELREAVARAGQRLMRWPRRAGALAGRLPRLPGRRRLLEAVRAVLREGPTDSGLERLARRRVRAVGLRPAPGLYPVLDHRGELVAVVDIAFPHEKVAVEVDGFAYHATPAQLRRDQARQNRLHALGWVLVRVSAAELRDGGADFIEQLCAVLARRGDRATAAGSATAAASS